ncbi:uncharacterized protein METZ01_LOCUS41244 [marine metagenome]|uniref:Uncharacterized protein n=1 Tax=marine metagenome TaxID=408172 RepID=A0A381R9T2_9ZZZZ
MLSLAETALEGAGVGAALVPQATNATVRKIISPVIDRRQPRFVRIDLYMICGSPNPKIFKRPV